MQDLLWEQLQARKERKNYAMVTIVDSFGSTPRTNGKMLVYENGLSKGTVGGGHHEQMAKRDAVACIAHGQNALKRYEIKAPAAASGAVCTGGDRRCHHGRDHRRAARDDTKLFLTPQFLRKGRRSNTLRRPFPSVETIKDFGGR